MSSLILVRATLDRQPGASRRGLPHRGAGSRNGGLLMPW